MGPRYARAARWMLPAVLGLALPARSQTNGVEFVVSGFREAARAQAGAEAVRTEAVPPPVNLLDEFVDPSTRVQGDDIASCHAFGSVAVLEAAYDRRYHEHIRLAEEDVFLQRTILSGDAYDDFCKDGDCELQETNYAAKDISYVIENGTLTGGDYAKFAKRYRKYRSAEDRTMVGVANLADENDADKDAKEPDLRVQWKQLATEPGMRRLVTDSLEGRGSYASPVRAEVQKKFSGFRLRSKTFDFGYAQTAYPSQECLKRGVAQGAALKAELDLRRPVCVTMAMPAAFNLWDDDDSAPPNHIFAIVGYETVDGETAFHVRDSMGARNRTLHAKDLCLIFQMDSVLTPDEKETF